MKKTVMVVLLAFAIFMASNVFSQEAPALGIQTIDLNTIGGLAEFAKFQIGENTIHEVKSKNFDYEVGLGRSYVTGTSIRYTNGYIIFKVVNGIMSYLKVSAEFQESVIHNSMEYGIFSYSLGTMIGCESYVYNLTTGERLTKCNILSQNYKLYFIRYDEKSPVYLIDRQNPLSGDDLLAGHSTIYNIDGTKIVGKPGECKLISPVVAQYTYSDCYTSTVLTCKVNLVSGQFTESTRDQ